MCFANSSVRQFIWRKRIYDGLNYIAHEFGLLSMVIEWNGQHTMDINNYERS